jgi:hypothetical protein
MSVIELIENKVASSGLITLNLEDYYHSGERIHFDIKNFLFREMILKEKDFREMVKSFDWEQFKGKNIAFYCSTDAIIPTWAYMVLAIAVEPFVNRYVFGNLENLDAILFHDALNQIKPEDYTDQRVIIKGCSHVPVPIHAYVEITHKLLPFVKSLMYGEACSNVPLYKKKA